MLARQLSITLYTNLTVCWYFFHKCSECAAFAKGLGEKNPQKKETQIRAAKLYVLSYLENFVTYTISEVMDEKYDFIYAWKKE